MGLVETFKGAFKDFLRWALDDSSNKMEKEPMPTSLGSIGINSGNMTKSRHSITEGANGMNFTVYSATGGKVIQFSSYNPNTDRHYNALYVVTDKEDLGEEIAQIITRESLTR